jgi:hypothetical protein
MNDYFPWQSLVTIRPEARGKLPADAVYRVADVPGGRRTKYLVEDVRTGARITAAGLLLAAYDGPEIPEAAPLPLLHVGTAVRVEAGHKLDASKPHVVLGMKADGGVKLVVLGGDAGRYYPSIPRQWLTELTAAEVATMLA